MLHFLAALHAKYRHFSSREFCFLVDSLQLSWKWGQELGLWVWTDACRLLFLRAVTDEERLQTSFR